MIRMNVATEEYYKELLEEAEKTLSEATSMINDQAKTIEDLMKLLKEATVQVENLENFLDQDEDGRVLN